MPAECLTPNEYETPHEAVYVTVIDALATRLRHAAANLEERRHDRLFDWGGACLELTSLIEQIDRAIRILPPRSTPRAPAVLDEAAVQELTGCAPRQPARWTWECVPASREEAPADPPPPPPEPAPPGVLTPEQCAAFLRGEPGASLAVRYSPVVLPARFITRDLDQPTQTFEYRAACRPSPLHRWSANDAQITLRSRDLREALERLDHGQSTTPLQNPLLLLWIPPEQPEDFQLQALLQRGYGGPGTLVPVPAREALAAEEDARGARGGNA